MRSGFLTFKKGGENMGVKIDAQPVLATEVPKAVKRVMDRYGYTYYQCCTMPFNLLIFLHDCAKAEEDRPWLLGESGNE